MYRLCIGYVLDRTIEKKLAHLVAYRKEITTPLIDAPTKQNETPPDIDWLSLLDNPPPM